MSCPALVSKLLTPKILWYQTDVQVVVRVLIEDVDDYFLRVECDHLLFSTRKNCKSYYICLYLFGAVVAGKTSHVNLGREIKIFLVKGHKWIDWLRLQIEKDKNRMIISDPDHLYKDDRFVASRAITEKEEPIGYQRRNDGTQIMPDMPSSDEDSEDERMDMLYA